MNSIFYIHPFPDVKMGAAICKFYWSRICKWKIYQLDQIICCTYNNVLFLPNQAFCVILVLYSSGELSVGQCDGSLQHKSFCGWCSSPWWPCHWWSRFKSCTLQQLTTRQAHLLLSWQPVDGSADWAIQGALLDLEQLMGGIQDRYKLLSWSGGSWCYHTHATGTHHATAHLPPGTGPWGEIPNQCPV